MWRIIGFTLALVSSANVWKCGGNVNILQFGPSHQRFLTTSSQESAPIRLFYYYYNFDLGSSEDNFYFQETLMKYVTNFFSRALKVKSIKDLILISGYSHCGGIPIPEEHGTTGVANTDVLFYISTDYEASASYLAYAGVCFLNGDNLSPMVAEIIVNAPNFKKTSNEEKYFTMIHEITHALAFSSNIFSFWRNSAGDFYREDEITSVINVRGTQKTIIKTPNVVETAKNIFECDSLQGIELEEAGGSGTVGSHWDKRVMLNDYMVGASGNNYVVSEITLALFQDSGWYDVDRTASDPSIIGKGLGCDYFDRKCLENQLPVFPEIWCAEEHYDQCDAFLLEKSMCILSEYNGDLPIYYQYFTNPSLGGIDQLTDFCPYRYEYSNGNCRGSPDSTSFYPEASEVIGVKSRCFYSTLISDEYVFETPYSACYEVIECSNEDAIVKIGNYIVSCPFTGATITLPGYSGSLACPASDILCRSVPCIGGCFGSGKCVNSLCQCYNGHYGDDCSGFCQENCDICNSSSECTACSQGYNLQAGVCMKACTENCAFCNELSCTQCYYGFSLIPDSGTCQTGFYCLDAASISLVFTPEFDMIVLSSNLNLESAANTDCLNYFIDINILGVMPICVVTGKQLIITLGSNYLIRETSLLVTQSTFHATEGSVSPSCEPLTLFAFYTPGTNPFPTAAISGPPSIFYSCSDFKSTQYSSSSYGFGSGTFSYEWHINGVKLSIKDQTISINNNDYSEFSTITIDLTVSNSIGFSHSSSLIISLAAEKQTSMRIETGTLNTYRKSSAITLDADGLDYCSILGKVSFEWIITPTPVVAINLTQKQLKIPKNALNIGNYNIQLTLRLTKYGVTTVNHMVIITLTIIKSALIAIIDKTNQEVSISNDILINAQKSYDPDGGPISYKWFLNNSPIIEETSSILKLTSNYLNSASLSSSFVVTLTISSADLRTSSVSVTFSVNPNTRYFISISRINSKLAISRPNFIQASISATSPSTFMWSQTTGPFISFKSNSRTLAFPGNKLVKGESYSFKVTITIPSEAYFQESSISFDTNKPPVCEGLLEVSPLTGIAHSTKFTVSIEKCSDEDLLDIPLNYKIYYVKTISILVSSSLSSIKKGLLVPRGVKKIAISVCDTMNDCYSPPPVSITVITNSLRNLKSTAEILYDFSQYLNNCDMVYSLNLLLSQYMIPSDTLDAIWNDFTKAISSGVQDFDHVTKVAQTILLFMGPEQDQSLVIERIKKYTSYLIGQMKMVESLDQDDKMAVTLVAQAVIQLDTSMENVKIADSLLSQILNLNSLPGSESFIESTSYLAAFKIENFSDHVGNSEIEFGSNSLSVSNMQLSNLGIVKIEAYSYKVGNYSDIVHIEITSENNNATHANTDNAAKNVNIPQNYIILSISHNNIGNIGCKKFNGEIWDKNGCSILSNSNRLAKVSIRSSGFYQLAN